MKKPNKRNKSNKAERNVRTGTFSLYTWIHHNIVVPNKEGKNPIKAFVGLRDDGTRVCGDIKGDDLINLSPENITSKRNSFGSQLGKLIHEARYHQINSVTLDYESGDSAYFLIVRLDDVTYQHRTKGEQVKHNVKVFELTKEEANLLAIHNLVMPEIHELISSKLLTAIVRDGKPDAEALEKLKLLKGDNSKEYKDVLEAVEKYELFSLRWNLFKRDICEGLREFQDKFANKAFLEMKPYYHVDENLNLYINTDSRLARLGAVLGTTQLTIFRENLSGEENVKEVETGEELGYHPDEPLDSPDEHMDTNEAAEAFLNGECGESIKLEVDVTDAELIEQIKELTEGDEEDPDVETQDESSN